MLDTSPIPRLQRSTHIADRLNLLAAIVKTRSRASLTDANRVLETVVKRFFNALFDWDLINLNIDQANFPAADLGDRARRIAIQVTNEDSSDKIKRTAAKAIEHHLGRDFDRLIVFFLLPTKPGFPKAFTQSVEGPEIQTWDIADLVKQMLESDDLETLFRAGAVLDEELGKHPEAKPAPRIDISRIFKYAPAELIGRDDELKILNDAWAKTQSHEAKRPHILTFVGLGGEGKTSLVAKWAAELAAQGWPGCDAAFAWSFYSQGTRDQVAASSDLFLKEALNFFAEGDSKEAEIKAFAASSAGAFEKGQRLARVMGQRRNLLILDGLEPLQYASTAIAFKPGELNDQGITKLLKDLASANQGLCIVTTRIEVPDLQAFKGSAVIETPLKRLPREAGVRLLKSLGVSGIERRNLPLKDGDPNSEKVNEFEKLVEDVKGHALTLTLLGGFLKRAFHGDIRQRDRVKFEKADEKMDGGHAFRTMAAYENWLLRDGGEEGLREVAVLRLMGLFDRPADADCFMALRSDSISGLTEPLAGLTEEDWEFCLSGLEAAKLLTVNRDAASTLVSLDVHPHLREYFAKQLRKQNPAAWRTAHTRLYEHLCATAPDSTKHPQENALIRSLGISIVTDPTLEDLQTLYQAVAHACHANLHEKGWCEVFLPRILRGNRFYSYQKLGAVGSDLGALSCFFDTVWTHVSPLVTESTRGRVLNAAGLRLRMLGRLSDALDAQNEAVKTEKQQDSITPLRNLSELRLKLGNIGIAIQDSLNCMRCADDEKSTEHSIVMRTIHGDALHQEGRYDDARRYFLEAEQMQVTWGSFSFLYSLHGFRYCDLLLAIPERAAWLHLLKHGDISQHCVEKNITDQNGNTRFSKSCHAVRQRAAKTLSFVEINCGPLEIALDHLTLGRISLYEAVLTYAPELFIKNSKHQAGFDQDANDCVLHCSMARSELDISINYFHQAGSMDELPFALLLRAWLRFLTNERSGTASAHEDLDAAWEIAIRGPMRLFLVDIYLYRARLFGVTKEGREMKYPWKSPQQDLAEARKLIESCGYWRRKEELEDAEKALAQRG
jgi:tetratricopeptide (TPR) repeat protein